MDDKSIGLIVVELNRVINFNIKKALVGGLLRF